MSARILVIDPDPNAIEALQNALEPKAASWTLVTAQNETDALAAVEDTTPDIVVTSLAANQGDGLALLSKLIDRAPLAHAYIRAGEDQKPSLSRALEGGCHFLSTELSSNELLEELKTCLSERSWQTSPQVEQVLEACSQFQSLPDSYLQIARAIQSPNASISDVAELISLDLALSAKVLETVNSPFYGFGKEISDLSQAINLLGLGSLQSIVLAIKVFDYIGQSTTHCALVSEIWNHSIDVAAAARRITLHTTDNPQEAELAYSAGLLHDIGKLILLEVIPDQFIEAQRRAYENSRSTWRSELEAFGCDHAEVGARLLANWNLPSVICQTTALHHRPANACQSEFSILTAVHAANTVVRKRKQASHADAIADQAYLHEIGLSEKRDEWELVARGQPLPTKPKLSIKREAPTDAPPPPITTTRVAHDALSRAIEDAQQKKEQREERLSAHRHTNNVYLAFAAGIVCCLSCIYFLSTIEDAPAQEPESIAPSQGANYGSRQDILDEIMSSDAPSKTDATPKAAPSILTEVIVETPPSEPPPPPPPPFPEIQLGAIFHRSSGAKAQVNGRILGVGDTIEGARITAIEQLSITAEHYGRTKTFTLN
ncbi:HDOD domain-containing protein [Pelagicoccus mobilis]|uniref:HDOD domain-containing protein n=1 Tax=Pelagicoccus mobilis TaxID=415221 RepID=A0A934S0E6_9BACT|nr:HDOD domain-containing protein [Pelagicoccus mobilis]MBK1879628.1 HDOD domain-containing protein [Pelagicoccus mobilis]